MIGLLHASTGQNLDIAPNTSITLNIENPLLSFAFVGNYSFPFTLPATSKNIRFFEFFNLIKTEKNYVEESYFYLIVGNSMRIKGSLKLISSDKSGFKVNFNSVLSTLKFDIRNVKLNQFLSPSFQFGFKIHSLRTLIIFLFEELGINKVEGSFMDWITDFDSYSVESPQEGETISRDFIVWFYDEGLENTIFNFLENLMFFFNVAYIFKNDAVSIEFRKDSLNKPKKDFGKKIKRLVTIDNETPLHYYFKFAQNVVKAQIANVSPAIVYPDGYFNFQNYGVLEGSDILQSNMLPVSIRYDYDGTNYDTVPALGLLTPTTFVEDYKKYSYLSVRTHRYINEFLPNELTYLNKDPFDGFCFDFSSNRSIPGAYYGIGLYERFWNTWDYFNTNKRPCDAEILYDIVDLNNDFWITQPVFSDGVAYFQEKIQLQLSNTDNPFSKPAKVKLQKIR